jgi:hypothetical protein
MKNNSNNTDGRKDPEKQNPLAACNNPNRKFRFKRWLTRLFLLCLIMALCVFAGRRQLKQAVIACKIYQAGAFTPPPKEPDESSLYRLWTDAQFFWDIAGVRVARDERVKELGPEIKSLLAEVNRRQANGEHMVYSMHIYREVRWRLNFTSDIKATKARLEDLRRSLDQPGLQKQAAEQQAADGSWAMGINEWYLRLYYSVDEIEDKLQGRIPQYPLSFLDRVNSPEKLTAQLESDLRDDFTRTGVLNREETDETFSAMARLLLKTNAPPYAFHPQLAEALRGFVKRWQNPDTGCWGQWLMDRRGRIWKMDDVGMTFHVVSDLHGQIDHADLIARRLLQLDRLDFPAGIRMSGHYENHLNWDAVKIYRVAWPLLDNATRDRVRAEISAMLDWCLKSSLQSDGSFKTGDIDDTLADACNYGDCFLNETGYYDPEKRFWTDQDFPEAQAIHKRVSAKLKTLGDGG